MANFEVGRKGCFVAGVLVLFSCGVCADDSQSFTDQRKPVRELMTQEQLERLEAGKVVLSKKGSKDEKGNDRGRARAMILVEKPPQALWNCIRNYKEQPEYMPHLVKAEKYFEEGNRVGLQQTLKILYKKVTYHILQTFDHENKYMTWRIDTTRENDIENTEGSWRFVEYGSGRTVAIYTVSVDSGMSIPGFLANFLLNRDVPKVVKALKERAESDDK